MVRMMTVLRTHDPILVAVLMAFLMMLGPTHALAGDAAAGEAQAAPCAACHGQDGATGLDGTYPNLAGQNEKYLLRQLKMIQTGDRNIALMAGQLNGKSEDDLANLAAYYASLPAKIGQAQGEDDQIARAEALYRNGDGARGMPACTACHAPSGAGNGPAGFPQISGQPVEYTVAQLTAYREGQRTSDEDYAGMMRDVARSLTDTEIAALADYVLGLN